MNELEFLDESKEYIIKRFESFFKLKSVLVEIYEMFHQLCMENGIHYFLSYGSLLGQIRDGGFIPWDPDIDTCISIDEVDKLIRVLSEKLPEEYFFVSNFTHRSSKFYQIRIGKKGYDLEYIHVDVFYVVGVPKDNEQRFVKKVRRNFLQRQYYYESRIPQKKHMSKLKKIARKMYYFIKCGFTTKGIMDRKFYKLSHQSSIDKSDNVLCYGEGGFIYPKNIIFPPKIVSLNNSDFLFPNDEKVFLKITYGDYMEYMSIKKRYDEFDSWMKFYERDVKELQ